MFAPQIQNLLSFTRPGSGTSPLPLPGRRKLDELFAVPDRFEAVGNDNLHALWLRAERGPIEAFVDVGECLEEGAVSSREEFESWGMEESPFKEKWFRLSAAEYRGTYKIGIIPAGIFPRYSESWFPVAPISYFMNLPCEKPTAKLFSPTSSSFPRKPSASPSPLD